MAAIAEYLAFIGVDHVRQCRKKNFELDSPKRLWMPGKPNRHQVEQRAADDFRWPTCKERPHKLDKFLRLGGDLSFCYHEHPAKP
jgi:hypothetical protein